MGSVAAIALGSNLGDRRATLDGAVEALRGTAGVAVRAVSRYHETRPIGGPPDQPAFLNAAATLEVELSPQELLGRLQEVEARFGRVRETRWDARTLDLDLLLYGSTILHTTELTLPHPRFAVRRFVLGPLAEVAPDMLDPLTRRSVEDLLAHLDRRPSYLALDVGSAPDQGRRLIQLLRPRLRAQVLPTPVEPDSEHPDMHTQFERALALDSAEWTPARLGEQWLVSPFCLDLDLLRIERHGFQELHRDPSSNGHAPMPLPESDQRELNLLVRSALTPTLAFTTDATAQARLTDFPLLLIRPDEVEDAAADILAACQATRPD